MNHPTSAGHTTRACPPDRKAVSKEADAVSSITFHPLDDIALDGAHYLVRDEGGYMHCARWSGTRWEYGCSMPVASRVVEYRPRQLPAGRL